MSEEDREGFVPPIRQEWLKFVRENTDQEIVDRLIKLEEELAQEKRLSITDSLTGLLNKRGLNDAWKRIYDHLRRHPEERSGSVVVIDLNNFKKANDTYGHAAGDAALQVLAEILIRSTRPEDTRARIGGDEFVIYLDGADEKQSEEIMQRINNLYITELAKSNTFKGEVVVTLSWGISELERHRNPNEVVKSADQKMYVYKDVAKSGIVNGDVLDLERNLGFDK